MKTKYLPNSRKSVLFQANSQRKVHTHGEKSVQWTRWLFDGLIPQRCRLDPRPVHVGFMVGKLSNVVLERMKKTAGPIVPERKKYYKESRRTGTSHKQQKEARLTGLVTSCVGTAFSTTLLKEHLEER
jgi:hypothetical protein